MSFSSTPDDGSYRGGFQKSEGTKLSYHYVEISPLLTYGKAKRLQVNRRIETFFGLNYGLSFQVTSLKENHTLVDSTQFASWWNSPFNSQSHNNDFYKRKRTRQGLEGSISPFLGMNYFITEKIALGGYYSFGGFSVNVPVGGKETVQRRVQGSIDSQNISYKVHAGISSRLALFGYGGIMLNYALGRGKG